VRSNWANKMSRASAFAGLLCATGALVFPALAQDFVLDSYYDCARATNGKSYCKQVGKGGNYFPVPDEFLVRLMVSKLGQQNVTTNTTVTASTTTNTPAIQGLTNDASEIRGLIDLYTKMIAEQKQVATGDDDPAGTASQAIAILNGRIAELQKQFKDKTTQLSTYQTSIRPNDPDLRISARKASELYPKVPWYIPGTSEIGEFWIEPFVTDTGSLSFNLKFVDPKGVNDKVRATILLETKELDRAQKALLKLVNWSKVAHDKGIRRALTKRVDCFPSATCPDEGKKRDGVASTEIVFQVNEEGATSGRIQRNKGLYDEGYNISMESAVWLQAYLNHVLREGKSEFEAGSRSTDELKDLLR
jgi:hypothetical protein